MIVMDDGGRPIIAPVPPELMPTWQQTAEAWPSPYGAAGEQQFSASKVCAQGAITPLFQWAGPGARPYNLRLSITPEVSPQDLQPGAAPIPLGNMIDQLVFARVRWQLGNARYEADLDLVRGSLAVPLMATRLEVFIVNGAGSAGVCGYACAVAPTGRMHSGAYPETQRTILTTIPPTPALVQVPVPAFARAFYVGAAAANALTIATRDTKGTVTFLVTRSLGNTVPREPWFPVLQGAATIQINSNAAGNIDAALVFFLGLP